MFTSLKMKILFFIVILMTVTACTIIFFTFKEVGGAMLGKEKAEAENVLTFVNLIIEEGYTQLFSNKIYTILEKKKQLKNIGNIPVTVLEGYSSDVKKGALTEEEAIKRARQWLRSARFENNLRWYAFDENGVIVAHPDGNIEGGNVNDLEDMKGRRISGTEDDLYSGGKGAFHVYRSTQVKKKEKRLGYFIGFDKWKWTIVVEVDIHSIEEEYQKKLKKITLSLKKSLAGIRIADTGTIFLFNRNRKMIIPPRGEIYRNYILARNRLTGKMLLEEMIETVENKKNSLQYLPDSGNEQVMLAHVGYFKALDWYISVVAPMDEINLPAVKLINRQFFIIGMIFFLTLLVAWVMVNRIVQPLNLLAECATKLAAHDFTSRKGDEELINSLPTHHNDEVGRLAEAFIFMVDELKSKIIRLIETTASKERIQSELAVASEIQQGILPKIFPTFPNCDEVDIFAFLEPAKEVGGDLYDFFFIDDDHLCFAMGDVSDKGVPAALFMAITTTLIKTSSHKSGSPGEMMAYINRSLSAENPNSMFVTLVIGILNIRTGEVRYANGGHNPPILISREKGIIFKEEISGPIVGVIEDLDYKDLTMTLGSNDALFLYTDGVTEAMSQEKKVFSDEKLLLEIEAVAGENVETVVSSIEQKVAQHVGGAPRSDDITMLMLRYNGNETTH